MSSGGRRGLFVDRDGTLIDDVGYLDDHAGVWLLPGVEILRDLREVVGYRLVVAGNQSGVGRGRITAADAAAVQREVVRQLEEVGIELDGAFFCLHAPDAACDCRKPEPGLLLHAAAALGLDLDRSVMVGDKQSDVDAGRAAGCAAVAFGPLSCRGADVDGAAGWHELGPWLLERG